MPRTSSPELLTLHAVRLKGMADDRTVAARFSLDEASASATLLDQQAFGWVSWTEFAGIGGWSLTDAGRAENERQLAAELELVHGGQVVRETYRAFHPLNERLLRACTDWQIRPTRGDALAFNDHSDRAWDGRVVEELTALGLALRPLSDRLRRLLDRFGGYDVRFDAALGRVMAGDRAWVNRPAADSCHTVWFELHEDLLATLGLERGAETG